MAIQISGTTVINNSAEIATGMQSIYDRTFAVGVNTTLQNRDFCEVTTAGLTITLPTSPTIGNEVKVGVGTFIDTVVARNSSSIMSLAEDITLDAQYVNVGFLFVGGTVGWRIF
jgi:bifunctional N-acetylglucosamine-1-phosphate-uridyltransferase/glucosamine-1-phosphate-acetyltransferase GlmU-like protein